MTKLKTEPKYRRPLNTEQIIILELLCKFRFATVALVRDYFYETNPGMDVFRRLETLVEQGLITKRRFDDFRLLHKPVIYYLWPAGARKLNEHRDEGDKADIKSIYRDSLVSEQFAMHCVTVFDLYNRLMAQYGDDLEFLAKSDQASLDNLPRQKPDAYLSLETKQGVKHYFVDILDDDAHLLIDASKKIKRYIDYKKSGSWTLVSDQPFPEIIFICKSESDCERVQKRCEAILQKDWTQDLSISVTTSPDVTMS